MNSVGTMIKKGLEWKAFLSQPDRDPWQELQEQQLPVKEFGLAAVEGEKDKWYHQWVLGYDGPEPPAEETIAYAIDAFLSERHKNYEVARRKSLAGVKVRLVPAERFYNYQAQDRDRGGHIKTRKVISPEAMRDFLAFMDK